MPTDPNAGRGWNLFNNVFNTGDPSGGDGSGTNRQTGFQQNKTGNSFDLGKALGVVPTYLDSNSPGSSVDTSGADAQRANMQSLVDALQQQAATGDGDWQKTLAAGTQSAQNTASALGQEQNSQGGVGYATALRNIGNAQSGASQQAAGESNILRAQSQQDAQSQLGGLNAAMNTGDINQANAAAGALQGTHEANAALTQQANTNASNLTSSIGKAFSFISKGGKVPGKPRVFGDDERNDTVPAMLSPGEIVVPRTQATDPKKAAAFARAVAMRHGKHLAGGGTPDSPDTGTQLGFGVADFFGAGIGNAAQSQWLNGKLSQDPSIENGGQLATDPYNQSMAGLVGAANSSMAAAPTVTGQQITNASDNSIAGAMGQNQRAAASAAVLSQALKAQQAAGANAAQTRLGEKTIGQKQAGQDLTAARQNAIGMASDQQQAAWNNTMLNSGLTLANQQALKGILSSMGQGAAQLSQLGKGTGDISMTGGGGDEPGSGATPGNDLGDQTPIEPDESNVGDEPGSGAMEGDGSSSGGGGAFARGGSIPNYDEGGRVVRDSGLARHALAQLRADYDSEQAKRAIDKGPDLAYRARQFVDAVQRGASNVGAMMVPAAAAASMPMRVAPVATVAPVVQRPVMVPLPPPMVPAPQVMAMPVAPRRPVAQAMPPVGMERPALEDMEIQRAHGGSIPGYANGGAMHPLLMVLARAHGGPVRRYAEGGGVFDPSAIEGIRGSGPSASFVMPADQQLPPPAAPPPPVALPSQTGAQLGLAGGFAPTARVSFAPPSTDAGPMASNLTPAPNLSRDEITKTLVQTGTAADGSPIVEPRDAVVQRPLPKGLRLADDGTAPPAIKPTGKTGGVAPEKPLDTTAFDREQEAVTQQGETKAHQAIDEANALTAFHTQLASNAIAQQDQLKQAHEDASVRMAKYDSMVDEMKHINTSVDPDRYWASRSTGQKVMGIIGMALSALGSRDGTNGAADMIGKAIDRDLELQKADVNARLKKGEAALSGAQTAYGMNRQLFQDDLAATAAAKATALELADNQLKTIAATYSSPLAKEQAAQLSAQLQASRQKFIQQAKDQDVSNALKRAETAKAYAEAGKDARGAGINPAEVKDLHTAEATAQDSLDLIRTIRSSLDRAQSPVPGKTAYNENLGEEAPALGTAATQLTLKLKDMAKLGQISATDQALLDKLLGDPQAVWGRGSSEQAKQSRLTALEGIVKRSVLNQRRAALGVQAQ